MEVEFYKSIKNKTGVLNNNELLLFNRFLLRFIQFTNQRVISPIYRGDNINNLKFKLGLSRETNDEAISEMLDRLFMIGEKSRDYYSTALKYTGNFGINEINSHVAKIIFDNLNSALKNRNKKLERFFNLNRNFRDYFIPKTKNKSEFINSFLALNSTDGLFYRNYYLLLLHQLGSISYRENSHLVSSTTNIEVAREFSGDNKSERIIIHSWKPTGKLLFRNSQIKLPRYSGTPYPQQHEVSILAGILPHFIYGLEVVDANKFYINPHLFKNTISDDLFLFGMDIDQSRFNEVLNMTNYRRSFLSNGREIIS